MKLRYIFIPLLILAAAFLGLWYVNQRGSDQVIYPPSSAPLGCTRTTGTIDTNVLGIGQPAGFVMKDLPYLQDLGVKWGRTDFYWPDTEASEGVYRWNDMDNIVRVLNQNNIKLLLLIGYVPDWVWAKDRQGRIDAVYAFTKSLATRNKGKVRYYEIFNEPNLPGIGFFRERDKVDVVTYLDFLAAANKGIHEADPGAVVVMGGLAPGGTCTTACKGGEMMGAFQFMKQLYELGGKDCFDVLAYHPYDTSVTFKEVAAQIRAGMTHYGDSAKPIWFNEFGTNDESQQLRVMSQRKDELSAVPANFWFSLHDFSPSDDYGLLTTDYQKKPVYDLFKQVIRSQQ